MRQHHIKPYKAWFQTEARLLTLAEHSVARGFGTTICEDYENVYQWVEVSWPKRNLIWNISRKHIDGACIPGEPTTLLCMYAGKEPDNSFFESAAQQLLGLLNTEIKLGYVCYIEKDEFDSKVEKVFTP